MAIINGTAFSDTLNGTAGKDTIKGFGGNDVLTAGSGNDTLQGGDGRDYLHGNEGNDRLFGGKGTDNLYGGDGDDFIDPGKNTYFDWIDTGAGDDTVKFSAPVNKRAFYNLTHAGLSESVLIDISGVTGLGTVDKGANGTTTIINLNNALQSEGLRVLGTAFDDTIRVNPGDNGRIQIRDAGGSDSIVIGASDGEVALSYRSNSAGITADLGAKSISDGLGNTDVLSGPGHVTQFRATHHTDSITGSGADEVFQLFEGNDTLDGAGGNDWVNYGTSGSPEYAVVDLAAGKASIRYNGTDYHQTLMNIENVSGTYNGEDALFGNGKANIIKGRDGDDYLDGRRGKDKLYGEGDDDTLKGGGGVDLLDGGADDDILTGGAGRDTFVYTDGADRITDFKGGAKGDKLRLDDDLWGGLTLTKAKVLQEFASVVGDDTVFDFAGGDTLTLEDYTDIAGLKALIDIF